MPTSVRRLTGLLVTVAWAACLAPGPARAAEGVPDPCAPITGEAAPLHLNTQRTGLVDLHFFLAAGDPVRYFECLPGRAVPLGVRSAPGAAITSLPAAVPWSCDRVERHFAAYATRPDGSVSRGLASVRTGSCARRFALEVPAVAQRGTRVAARIVDRWGIGGITTRLCLVAPEGRRRCSVVRFPAGKASARRPLRLPTRGRWTAELQVRGQRTRGRIAVGVAPIPPAPLPRVLATGDSTMQSVDSSLADDLGAAADVVSDVRPGLAVSRTDWARIARSQVAAARPRVVVYSLGAAEGFAMRPAGEAGEVACCSDAWVAEYSRRMRQIFGIYRQGGRGRVVVLTIAAPKAEARRPIVAAVNRALVAAGTGLPGVRVLRMDLVFSPKGYQESIREGGRDVVVREPDGVHLNASGTAIEARIAAAHVRPLLRGRP